MSECVVRMEMPKGCWDCPCVNGEYGYCQADEENRPIRDPSERPSWCPIICSLPEGHGRLVDAEALLRDIEQYHVSDGQFQHWLELQSTIVPAERREKDGTD